MKRETSQASSSMPLGHSHCLVLPSTEKVLRLWLLCGPSHLRSTMVKGRGPGESPFPDVVTREWRSEGVGSRTFNMMGSTGGSSGERTEGAEAPVSPIPTYVLIRCQNVTKSSLREYPVTVWCSYATRD